MKPFLEIEADEGTAECRARKHDEFWTLVFATSEISYSEWKAMDMAEFYEAREAYLNYMDRVKNREGTL